MQSFINLRDHFIAEQEFSFTFEDFDYGASSELVSACYRELTGNETPDYLENHGYFAYHLLETARTEAERDLLHTRAGEMLVALVEFNLSQNSIYVDA